MKTTVIGSFPYKANIPNWFNKNKDQKGLNDKSTTHKHTEFLKNISNSQKKIIDNTIQNIIDIQEKIGISIFTNGEVGRENYIHFLLRNWNGMDFINLE